MVNTKLLDEKIEKSGYKKKAIAKILGITPASLKNKIDNKTEFNVSEYLKMEEILDLTLEESRMIFLIQKVERDSTEVVNG